MKKINKIEPDFYQNYISANKPDTWKQVSFDIGFDMRTYMLMEEQNFQCAYILKFDLNQNNLILITLRKRVYIQT